MMTRRTRLQEEELSLETDPDQLHHLRRYVIESPASVQSILDLNIDAQGVGQPMDRSERDETAGLEE